MVNSAPALFFILLLMIFFSASKIYFYIWNDVKNISKRDRSKNWSDRKCKKLSNVFIIFFNFKKIQNYLFLNRLHWSTKFRSKMPPVRVFTVSRYYRFPDPESEGRYWLACLNFLLLLVLQFFGEKSNFRTFFDI